MLASFPTRILVVDDHASVRSTIRQFLEHKTDFTVCGEADNGLTAVERATALTPDLVVMDLAMPGLDGVQAASDLKNTLPAVKIVGFSMYADELVKATEAGSRFDAVLPKESGLAFLAETIRRLTASQRG